MNVTTSQNITLTVTDACGVEDEFEVEVEVQVYDTITGEDEELCLGIQGDLNLLGGTGTEIAGNWVGDY